jgi:hypothetical protein
MMNIDEKNSIINNLDIIHCLIHSCKTGQLHAPPQCLLAVLKQLATQRSHMSQSLFLIQLTMVFPWHKREVCVQGSFTNKPHWCLTVFLTEVAAVTSASAVKPPLLRFLWGAVVINCKLRKILNGGNLTLILLSSLK